jgi:drug/metabolite transporter (DMT)-like permease
MTGVIGLLLVLAGVFVMAWSRKVTPASEPDRTAPLGLVVFFAGCVAVAIGAILITEWWLES